LSDFEITIVYMHDVLPLIRYQLNIGVIERFTEIALMMVET